MPVHVAVVRAGAEARLRNALLLGGLVLWLLYTRVFWPLKAMHTTLPACPFLTITGHPCPFCGGTRSFAYMWQGDLSDSVRLFPLGPLFFAGTVAGATGLAVASISGRTWTPRLTSRQWTLLGIFIGSAIAISWALKVFILGN